MSGKEKGKRKPPLRRRYTPERQLASNSRTYPPAPPPPQSQSNPQALSQPSLEQRELSQPQLEPRVERRGVSTHHASTLQPQPDSQPQISNHDASMSDQDVSADSYPCRDADTQNSVTGHTLTLDGYGYKK